MSKDIYPSDLNVETANGLDDSTDSTGSCMTNVMISIFTLATFHSCQMTYHLALYMLFTFCSLSDMQDAAHVMMTLDITLHSEWTDSSGL